MDFQRKPRIWFDHIDGETGRPVGILDAGVARMGHTMIHFHPGGAAQGLPHKFYMHRCKYCNEPITEDNGGWYDRQETVVFHERCVSFYNTIDPGRTDVVVFVVMTGSYSDLRLKAVCSTGENAQSLVSQFKSSDDPDIIQVAVDSLVPEDGLFTYECSSDLYQADWQIRVQLGSDSTDLNIAWVHILKPEKRDILRFIVNVKAKDKRDAAKIANEKRRAWAAEGTDKLNMMIEYVAERHGQGWHNWNDVDFGPVFGP